MTQDFASMAWAGKPGKATGRVLLGENHFATIAVTCRMCARQVPTRNHIDQLAEDYLATTSRYALALGRSLAETGAAPIRIEVDADCWLDEADQPRLSRVGLVVRGDVPGCDHETFDAAAREPTLLGSAWDLGANNVTVKVVANLLGEANTASEDQPEPPGNGVGVRSPEITARRRAQWSRILIGVVLLIGGVLTYLLIKAPEPFDVAGAVQSVQPTSSEAPPAAVATVAISGAGSSPAVPATVLAGFAVAAVAPSTPVDEVAIGLTSTPTLTPTPPPATPTSTPTPPSPTPAASLAATAVSFEETFSSNARHWPDDPTSTAWFASDGYRLTPRRATQFVALRAPLSDSFGDVRVTGVFRKVAGPPGGGYGLIVRDQSSAPLDGFTQIGRYYVFEVGDRDGVGIWRREGDRWIDILPWTPSAAVHGQDGTNELIAEAHGSQLAFFVNGVLVANAGDTTLAQGSVGIFTGGDGNDVLVTRFAVNSTS